MYEVYIYMYIYLYNMYVCNGKLVAFQYYTVVTLCTITKPNILSRFDVYLLNVTYPFM